MGFVNWYNSPFTKKKAIRNVTKSAYTAHTEPLHKEYNILKVQDWYQLAILKFYCKLVNTNLPQYFYAFTPQFSVGHINYNLRNPTRQLPIIRHEFPRQSLRYKLIATLNKIPDSIIAIAHNQLQQQFIHIVKDNMVFFGWQFKRTDVCDPALPITGYFIFCCGNILD